MGHHAIFISYRRDDTADVAGRIYDRLVAAFGEKAVFKDVDSLPFGSDFGAYIQRTLEQCRVVLVLIGPSWLEPARDGTRRIDHPSDWVRVEIERAFHARHVQVIPVLVNHAEMPSGAELPASIAKLASLNAAQVRRDPDFSKDMARLIDALREGALTGLVSVSEQPPQSPAARYWADISQTNDPEEYERFADAFIDSSEGFEARRRADRLRKHADAWDSVNWNSQKSIAQMLRAYPDHVHYIEAEKRLVRLKVRQGMTLLALFGMVSFLYYLFSSAYGGG